MRRVIVLVFVLSALCATVSANLCSAPLEAGRPTLGEGTFLLDVIGATVIGGTLLVGGKGRVPWTVLGVIFFVLLSNSLDCMNLSSFHIDSAAVVLMALLRFEGLGGNGAGKSTLMNLIGGVTPRTHGRMPWRGVSYAPASAADARAAGIAFIHQALNLFTSHTGAENLFIDGFSRRSGLLRGLINRRAMAERARAILGRLAFGIPPDRTRGALSPGERQLRRVARWLHHEAALIIVDEPTTVLTPRESDRLFATIEGLRREDRTVSDISHDLGVVRRVADRVAVLRDGRLVGERAVAEIDVPRMIRTMIGRDQAALYPAPAPPCEQAVLEAWGLSAPDVIEDVRPSVREGEILGRFGLMGPGRSELAPHPYGPRSGDRGSAPRLPAPCGGACARGCGRASPS